MAPELKITKQRIRNHFHYFWWQYIVLLIAAIFGWNLVHTTTRYRSPEYLKVEWYYEGASTAETDARTSDLLASVTPELFPEMEEVTFTMVGMDEMYGDMQLLVWSAAGQGDLYMLLEDSFAQMAANGSMCDLQPYIDDGTLNVEGIDLEAGKITNQETGEKVLVGLPTDTLTGFLDYHVDPEGKLMAYFLDNMR